MDPQSAIPAGQPLAAPPSVEPAVAQQMAMLQELSEIVMNVARTIGRQVLAAAARLRRPPPPPADGDPSDVLTSLRRARGNLDNLP